MRNPPGRSPFPRTIVVAVLLLFAAAGTLPAARAAGYPPVPPADQGAFLESLAAPSLAPGGAGEVALTVHDPLPLPLTSIVVSLEVYAFNAYPGNATGPVPPGSVTLGGSGTPASNVSLPDLSPGAAQAISVAVASSSASPTGTYAVRTAITFTENGTAYRLASRGYFDAAAWAAATSGPNGTTELNVSRLGVSGVVPETAVLVRTNPFPLVLVLLAGVGAAVVGAGAYFAARERPGSTSGTRPTRDVRSAPSAFGKRRTSDGD